jgi:organic radical activating enzyme
MIELPINIADRSSLLKSTTVVASTTLPIVETFHSIQGEGFWVGTNAFFIRLAGCDVGCSWCDTKQSWVAERHPQRAIAELVAEAVAARPAFVVITGGEPLLHNLQPLTQALRQAQLRIHLETSGAHPLSGEFSWVTLSPKQLKPPQASVYARVNELKVVVRDQHDFAWAEQQASKVPAATVKYLQPEWTTPESQRLIYEYVLKHPKWRISLQTHKLIRVK